MEPPAPSSPKSKGLSGPALIKLIGIGWTVLAAMGLVACFFNLIMRLLVNSWDPSQLERMQHRGGFRDYMSWWEGHAPQILIIGFVLNASTIVASVSLVRRRPWALTMLQFLIGGHMASLLLFTVFQLIHIGSFMRDQDGPKIEPGFVRPAFTVFFVGVTLMISAGFCIMYALCIAGLRSAKVKAELEGPPGGVDSSLKP